MMNTGMRLGRSMLATAMVAAVFLVALAPLVHELASAQVPQSNVALKTVVIPVEGMVCVVCAASVKQAIKSLQGVSRVEVDLAKRSARVTFVPERISADRVVAAINSTSGAFHAGTPMEVE